MNESYETPEEMIFGANLDEFAAKVGLVCGLESNKKLTSEEAYQQIKELWRQLKKSKKNLLTEPDAEKR